MTLSDLQPLFSRCPCADSTFPNLSIMKVASFPLRDTRSLLGKSWGFTEREQNHPFPQVSKVHTERTVCLEEWGHSFLPPPLPQALWAPPVPQAGRKLIHQQNLNYLLICLGTESAPHEVPSSASWWGRNRGNCPSLWWHWVISSSLTSNCFLRTPSHTTY